MVTVILTLLTIALVIRIIVMKGVIKTLTLSLIMRGIEPSKEELEQCGEIVRKNMFK